MTTANPIMAAIERYAPYIVLAIVLLYLTTQYVVRQYVQYVNVIA